MNRTFQGIIIAAIPVIIGLAFLQGMHKMKLGAQSAESAAQSFDAKKFVTTTCTSCHGADLHGAFGPDLHKKAQELSAAQIADILKNGKGNMPKGLAPGHEDDIAKYIKSLADAK